MNRAELMSNPEADREPHEEEQALTPERAAKLIFYSYRFSQGEPSTQHDILHLLHEQHPGWTLAESEQQEALEQLGQMLERFAERQFGKSHKDMSMLNVETEKKNHIERYLSTLLGGLDMKHREWREGEEGATKDRILWSMIKRDRQYSREAGGRPGSARGRDAAGSHRADRDFSFTLGYILTEKSAGMPEYDTMLAALRETLRDRLEERDATWEDAGIYRTLEGLVAHFNETHPDNPVSLEAFGA